MAPYVPPQLRNKPPAIPSPSPFNPTKTFGDPSEGYTLREIAAQFHYGQSKLGTLNTKDPRRLNDPKENEKPYDISNETLGFIIIFKDQHPQWPPKVLCKSNLHLLPNNPWAKTSEGEEPTSLPASLTSPINNDAPVPNPDEKQIHVFHQSPQYAKSKDAQIFFYSGTHVIKNTTYLRPRSKALIAMLNLKFTPQHKERLPEAWEESLKKVWAVVEMEKVGGEEENPMRIEEGEKKGVRELLGEMRLGNGDGGAEGSNGEGNRGKGFKAEWNGLGRAEVVKKEWRKSD